MKINGDMFNKSCLVSALFNLPWNLKYTNQEIHFTNFCIVSFACFFGDTNKIVNERDTNLF